jgi:hypothetical protein
VAEMGVAVGVVNRRGEIESCQVVVEYV